MHFNIGLVLGLCALANCLPTIDEAPREDSELSDASYPEMQTKYNIMGAQPAALNVSSVSELATHFGDGVEAMVRPELDKSRVCRYMYRYIMYRWIVQVPESWYIPKFQDANEACKAWRWEMRHSMALAGVIMQECGRREGGDLDGWLHMRFTTMLGTPGSKVEAVIARMGDPKGMVRDPKVISCPARR